MARLVEVINYKAPELCTELGLIGYAVMPGRLLQKNRQSRRQLVVSVPSEITETEEMREKAQRAIEDFGGKVIF